MPADRPPLIWLIDDTPAHHQVAEATVAAVGGFDLAHFASGEEALVAGRAIARQPGARRPAIVLMDFFLGDAHGDEVARRLRAELAHGPLIIGYSSVRACSERIVAAGGDLVLRKHVDELGINPTLRRYLEDWRLAGGQGRRRRASG